MSTSRTTTDAPASPSATAPARSTALRPVLWALLVLSAVGNTVLSATGASLAVQLPFSLVTGVCLAALVVGHLRRRR